VPSGTIHSHSGNFNRGFPFRYKEFHMEDLTGKQLGPYQIVEPLGEGGMASVYKAYQPSMERYVALKILPRHFANDPEFISRFSQEARVIANLQHPHILPVHDFGEAEGYTYLVMRFVEGGTLSDWLKNRHPLPLNKIRSIMTQVGGALHYAHAQGVIHRDIKPSNILVDQWDNCLLTDFGLAKMVASTARLTQTGGILGTPAYMSPEQGLGQQIDHRSDLYSLGVVLYQMAVGDLPYQAETPMAVVIKHIHDPLPPPRRRQPDLPEAIELVILKSLAKNPDERYATAGQMVKALQSATEAPTVAKAAAPETEVVPPLQTPDAAETVVEPFPAEETLPLDKQPSGAISAIPDATPQPIGQRPRPKSKMPWILAGVGVVVAAALIIVIISSLSGGEEGARPGEDVRETGLSADAVTETQPEPAEPGQSEQTDRPAESDLAAIDALLQEVEMAYQERDLHRAAGLLDEAIALQPEMAGLYCQRGYTLSDLEAYSDAAANFEQCRMLAERQGETELRVEAHGQLAFSLAQAALVEQDNPELALQALDEGLQDPIAPGWLYCERAEMKLQIGDGPGAMADFETCQTHDDIGDYWQVRSRTAILEMEGSAALAEGDFQAAIERFTAWSELEPEAPWPQCYLGEAWVELGELEQGLAAFERCQAMADDPEAHRWPGTSIAVIQAHQAEAAEDWDRALQAFSEAIELSPDDAWIYCERGELFKTLGAVEEARRDIQMCLELSGDDRGVREWAEGLLQDLEANTP
jgi:serine/threonine protein kinase/tetratricopeptide (TPR) repeat protein